jgi:hypothetical protein
VAATIESLLLTSERVVDDGSIFARRDT